MYLLCSQCQITLYIRKGGVAFNIHKYFHVVFFSTLGVHVGEDYSTWSVRVSVYLSVCLSIISNLASRTITCPTRKNTSVTGCFSTNA